MKEETKQKIRAYDMQYKRDNYKAYTIRLNKDKDKKIIKQLEKQKDKTNYIKNLIADDIKK